MLFRFWVFPDCTFLDISTVRRLPAPFSLPGIPALSCGHTPAAFQGFAPGTPLNTAGGRRGSFPFWLLRFPPAFAGFPARSVLQAVSLHSQTCRSGICDWLHERNNDEDYKYQGIYGNGTL